MNRTFIASALVMGLMSGCAAYAKMAETANGVAHQTVDFTFECDGPVSVTQSVPLTSRRLREWPGPALFG